MFQFKANINFTNSINFITPVQIAPTTDTRISPGEMVKIQAHSVSHHVGVPGGLNGYITADPDNIDPCLIVSDITCTMFDKLCVLLTNISNDDSCFIQRKVCHLHSIEFK